MHILFNTILNFAQAYNENAYGSGLYSADKATGSAGSSSAGGQLANTGFMIALIVTSACLLIFTALVIRFVRKKSSPTT